MSNKAKVRVIIPEAPAGIAAAAPARKLDPRRLRVGVLDNSKNNADRLLDRVLEGWRAAMDIASVVRLRKEIAAIPAPQDLLARLENEADIVLTAMAD